MVTHTSISDLLGMSLGLLLDVRLAVAEVLRRQREAAKGGMK